MRRTPLGCRRRVESFAVVAFSILIALGPGDRRLPAQPLEMRPLGVGNGLAARVVSSLVLDRNGFLWVGSREGLYRYDGYQAVRYLPDADDPASISDLDIRTVYEDADGVIWVGTNTGSLDRWRPETRHPATRSQPVGVTIRAAGATRSGRPGGAWRLALLEVRPPRADSLLVELIAKPRSARSSTSRARTSPRLATYAVSAPR